MFYYNLSSEFGLFNNSMYVVVKTMIKIESLNFFLLLKVFKSKLTLRFNVNRYFSITYILLLVGSVSISSELKS
jgi:hypothetical protein